MPSSDEVGGGEEVRGDVDQGEYEGEDDEGSPLQQVPPPLSIRFRVFLNIGRILCDSRLFVFLRHCQSSWVLGKDHFELEPDTRLFGGEGGTLGERIVFVCPPFRMMKKKKKC